MDSDAAASSNCRSSAKQQTFTIKFRRRRKMLSSVSYIILSLFLLAISLTTVYSFPFMPPSMAGAPSQAAGTECDLAKCIGGTSTQQSSLDSMPCPDLRTLHSCLKSLKCNGNFNYHTFMFMAKKTKKRRCRDGKGKGASDKHNESHIGASPRHLAPPNRAQLPDSTPTLRSGDSYASNSLQQLSSPKSRAAGVNSSPPPSGSSHQPQKPNQSEQYCLSAAYNFTIGQEVTSNSQFAATFKSTGPSVANPEELTHLYKSHLISDLVRPQSSYHLEPLEEALVQRGSGRPKSRKERVRRDTATTSDEQPQSDQPPLSAAKITEMLYKQVQPMTPSLTCMIFGDPHLRTFDSRYQTCNIVGARSLIEHPLFDVQITNSRLQDQFNATGVTRVVVQVRQFQPCSIGSDLVYETDSSAHALPPHTFTDGSTQLNSMIRITTSSKELGLVVTLHLDHIGVRVYISQFTHTKFYNVVIKFRTATSAAVKQKLVLDAISPISLCKAGCGRTELIDLEKVLNAAGIDTTPPAPGVLQEVVISKQPADGDDGDDYEDAVPTYDEDVASGSNFKNDKYDDSYYEDDDEYDDEDGDEDVNTDAMMQPQKDPRSKRVKKDVDTSSTTSAPRKNRKNKERKNKNRNKKNKDQSGSKRDLSVAAEQLNHQRQGAAVHQAFFALKPSLMVASKSGDTPSDVVAPPVPLASISSFLSDQQHRGAARAPVPELPPLKDQLFQNDKIPLHKPTLTDECNEMKGFYRLACLYDTVLLGIASNYPHKFASSFDEPRLPDSMLQSMLPSTNRGSGSSPSSASSSTINYVLALIVTLCAIRFRL